MQTVEIIGLPLACTNYQGAVDWLLHQAINTTKPIAVGVANTHLTTLNRHDRKFRESMGRFDLCVPDGMPLIWSINQKLQEDQKLKDRVYGPALMKETIQATANRPEYRHFLLGGTTATLSKLREHFGRENPGSVIAGSYSPPFGKWPEDEFDRIHDAILSAQANIIWVSLGCPKQEHWISNHKDRLPGGVYLGVGAAFAFHAGEVSQAPAYLQKRGMEWAYRLAMEPRRLFKRYLVYNTLFIWYTLIDALRT